MTTIPFLPNNTAAPPFQTSVVLDGAPYLITVTWLMYRPDWYVSLTDQSGTQIMFQPLIGSVVGEEPNYLFPNVFQESQIAYYPSTGNFVVTP